MSKEVNDALHTLLSMALENKKYETQKEQFDIVYKEIERLNNIINELEKYLNKVIQTSTEQEKITCSFVLQYLQELKGSDKE